MGNIFGNLMGALATRFRTASKNRQRSRVQQIYSRELRRMKFVQPLYTSGPSPDDGSPHKPFQFKGYGPTGMQAYKGSKKLRNRAKRRRRAIREGRR